MEDADYTLRYAFVGEWFQEEASAIRKFLILFYPMDGTIEIFDKKSNKTFLKRTVVSNLTENDFYVGSKLDIFGRQIEIIDYGNIFTKTKLSPCRERTFILLKSDALDHMGRIIDYLYKSGFTINNARMVLFNSNAAKEFFCSTKETESDLFALLKSLQTNPSVGLELISSNAINKLLYCLDENDSNNCEEFKNNSEINCLKMLFQEPGIKSNIYCKKDPEVIEAQIKYFFNTKNSLITSVQFKNSTLGIIKPHAIKEGSAGKIISDIYQNGFKITGFKMCLLDRVNCQEFYEVYRGVLAEYVDMVLQLSSSVCIAMEIVKKDNSKETDVHKEFREFCGPIDPEIGKIIRPNTLRAKYGKDQVHNALHCTDLSEDTILEVEYFFKVLES